VDESPPFDVDVARDDDQVVVRVRGELDMTTTPRLEDVLVDLDRDPRPLVVDLAGLTFIDSSGIRVLYRTHEVSKRRGRPVRLTRSTDEVMRALEIAGVRDLLPFATD
jgi:anti-sigma B factor antagonist